MLSRKVAMRVDSFLEISNHKGRYFLGERYGRAKGNSFLHLVSHLQVVIKIIIRVDHEVNPTHSRTGHLLQIRDSC